MPDGDTQWVSNKYWGATSNPSAWASLDSEGTIAVPA
jgi:hypothetical protein